MDWWVISYMGSHAKDCQMELSRSQLAFLGLTVFRILTSTPRAALIDIPACIAWQFNPNCVASRPRQYVVRALIIITIVCIWSWWTWTWTWTWNFARLALYKRSARGFIPGITNNILTTSRRQRLSGSTHRNGEFSIVFCLDSNTDCDWIESIVLFI